MSKPVASVSLDLDNKWSYMKTHGDPGWEAFPSYLDTVVPRVLSFLRDRNLTITFFVVGQDASIESNRKAIESISAAGHEIGNHSFHHEPWLHLYSKQRIEEEVSRAEESIGAATGTKTVGFRGPGFSFSQPTLEILARRGYRYDASTFPTFVGPLAKAYYFMTARLDKRQREERKRLFGSMREGFRPIKPYFWELDDGRLLEIPVTTMPVFRAPIHLSYLIYLLRFSRFLARSYLRFALRLCRIANLVPSLLLHPLDFLGPEDDADLGFFPGMDLSAERKIELVGEALDRMSKHYAISTMLAHADDLIEKNADGDGLRRIGIHAR